MNNVKSKITNNYMINIRQYIIERFFDDNPAHIKDSQKKEMIHIATKKFGKILPIGKSKDLEDGFRWDSKFKLVQFWFDDIHHSTHLIEEPLK